VAIGQTVAEIWRFFDFFQNGDGIFKIVILIVYGLKRIKMRH